jgi:phage antirepressor YoqD-like protein
MKSANELNSKLHDLGIQYKQNNTWVLYSKYSSSAYIQIKQQVLDTGKVVYFRKWSGLGREFLIKLFNNETSLELITC